MTAVHQPVARATTAWLAYPAGLLLVAAPLTEAVFSVGPAHPSQPGWRFTALVELASRGAEPVLGIVLMVAMAAWLDHRRTLRFLSAAALGTAALMLAAALILAVDVVTLRAMMDDITPRLATDAQFVRAVVVLLLGIGLLLGGGISGFAYLRETASEARMLRSPANRILVRKIDAA